MIRSISTSKIALALACLALLSSAVVAQNVGGVKGKIRTTKGSGIAGATVTARKKGADIKTTKANSSGEFVLDALETGRYNLVFEAPGYSSGVLYNVEVSKNKTADLGDRLILTPDQGNQIFLKGSVFDKQGFSVAGAKIEVLRVDADGSTKSLGNTYTSVSGEFTFHPQSSGKLRVTATYKGTSATKDIDVGYPAIYRLAIALDIPPKTGN